MDVEWVGAVTAVEYLRRDRESLAEARPVARAGLLSDTSVSVGVAMTVPAELTALCERRGWPVLRRSSGGTGLLHRPGDLLWSLILPAGDPRVGRGFVRAYGEYGRPIVEGLRRAGVVSTWTGAFALSDRFCLFGARGDVLAVGDRVLGGAAQHLTRAALLHHGVVGSSVDRAALQDLFGVPATALLARLTAYEECQGTLDLAGIGRAALRSWSQDPAEGRSGGI